MVKASSGVCVCVCTDLTKVCAIHCTMCPYSTMGEAYSGVHDVCVCVWARACVRGVWGA